MNNDVTIRRLRVEDAKASWILYNNKELWKYAIKDFCGEVSYENIKNAYENMLNDDTTIPMAILLKGVFVGVVKLRRIDRGYGELSYYVLRQDLWGNGIAKTAIEKMLHYGFVYGLDVISAFVNPVNERSYKMILGLDFYRAGISIKDNNVERLDITRTRWQTRELKYAN